MIDQMAEAVLSFTQGELTPARQRGLKELMAKFISDNEQMKVNLERILEMSELVHQAHADISTAAPQLERLGMILDEMRAPESPMP